MIEQFNVLLGKIVMILTDCIILQWETLFKVSNLFPYYSSPIYIGFKIQSM